MEQEAVEEREEKNKTKKEENKEKREEKKKRREYSFDSLRQRQQLQHRNGSALKRWLSHEEQEEAKRLQV